MIKEYWIIWPDAERKGMPLVTTLKPHHYGPHVEHVISAAEYDKARAKVKELQSLIDQVYSAQNG